MDRSTLGYIVIIVLLVVTSIFSLQLFLRQRAQHDLLDVRAFPKTIGEWTGGDLPITEKEYEILETKNLILREYANPSGDRLTLFIVYSETNRSVFHPPEVCLIGSGIDIVDKKRERIDFGSRSFFVNKLYLKKDNTKELVLYCYKAAGLYTDNYYLQQAYFAFKQLFGKRVVRGATIRASLALKEEDERKTLAALKSFLVETIHILESLS